MLFERTCRIAQDFDWFLRFVPPNSVEKRKNSKNQSENCKKTGSTILSPACFGNVRAIKDVFHVSVCDTSKSSANAAQFRLRCQKSTRINQKTAKKQAARFLPPACFDMFEPSKAFSMFLFMMPANQAASHCNQNQNANDQRCHLPVAFP